MKKSTLITTIAMIVVVVVALSTATYAWFSASTVSTATVAMTTTATSDWMIFEGAGVSTNNENDTNEKAYTFTSAAADAITLSEKNLQKGLQAPSSEAFANSISIDGTQAVVSSQEFLTAKRASQSVVKVDGDPTVYDPFVLKVSNARGVDDKSLKVTVVINAGVSQTTGTLYAAAATTFDIAYITTKENATAQQFTRGYSKCATKQGGYVSQDTVTEYATKVNASAFASGSSSVVTYGSATTMANGEYSNFKKVGQTPSAEETSWGLTAGQYYLAYSIVITDIDANDSVYFAIYPWIDGWAADNSAGGANYSINFAFTTAE